jgi:hypothetical protein
MFADSEDDSAYKNCTFLKRLCPTVHIPRSDGSLGAVTKRQSKYTFLATAMLLIYILQKSDLQIYVLFKGTSLHKIQRPCTTLR